VRTAPSLWTLTLVGSMRLVARYINRRYTVLQTNSSIGSSSVTNTVAAVNESILSRRSYLYTSTPAAATERQAPRRTPLASMMTFNDTHQFIQLTGARSHEVLAIHCHASGKGTINDNYCYNILTNSWVKEPSKLPIRCTAYTLAIEEMEEGSSDNESSPSKPCRCIYTTMEIVHDCW
jgi:hypothetical protein